MIIESLKLKNYRNYKDLDIELGKGLNIFIGDNAQGKTNILESIYTLALTKSYLNVKDKNLIFDGMIFAKLQAVVSCNGVKNRLEILINNDSKKTKINDKEIKKYSDYISRFRVLIFGPDSVSSIKDGPASRRKFLNVEISQISNKYVKLLQRYNVILRQRNELLKIIKGSNKFDKYYLDIINDKFCSLAVDIVCERKNFIDNINKYIRDIYREITDYDGLFIKYVSNVEFDSDKNNMKNKMMDKLNSFWERELSNGISLLGPHRDDFYFVLDDKDLYIYGSQGQFRAAVLALKLSEIDIFKSVTGDYPVLLLDDIFSEFDVKRKNRLINYILSDIQTIITTTDLNMIDDILVNNAKVFEISCGKLINDLKEGMQNE